MRSDIKLSILCPALLFRAGQWPILDSLSEQIASHDDVELLVLSDNGQMSVGEKHNRLFGMAAGEYLCTVADDDEVSDDYVDVLLETLTNNPSVDFVQFGVDWGPFSSSMRGTMFKPLAPIRSSIARRFLFPDWWQSEDRAYAVWLQEFGRNNIIEYLYIDRVLYRYLFRASKPEYGGGMYPVVGEMASDAAVKAWVMGQLV